MEKSCLSPGPLVPSSLSCHCLTLSPNSQSPSNSSSSLPCLLLNHSPFSLMCLRGAAIRLLSPRARLPCFFSCSIWCLGVTAGAFGARRCCCEHDILPGLLRFLFFLVGCYKRQGALCWFLVRCSSLRGCDDPLETLERCSPRVQDGCDLSNVGELLETRSCIKSCGITEAPMCAKQGPHGGFALLRKVTGTRALQVAVLFAASLAPGGVILLFCDSFLVS